MRVLVACEFSGRVRDAFIRLGHDAVSCDLIESEAPGPHIVADVRRLLRDRWDLVIAHPPCTYLANSGVRWLHSDNARWPHLFDAAEFFNACLNARATRVVVENPVMHKYGRALCGEPAFTVQPWMFGDNFKKRTCFWTRGPVLPLVPTSDLDGSTAYAGVHREAPGEDRQKNRSRTYRGIAEAMADRWGGGSSDLFGRVA